MRAFKLEGLCFDSYEQAVTKTVSRLHCFSLYERSEVVVCYDSIYFGIICINCDFFL